MMCSALSAETKQGYRYGVEKFSPILPEVQTGKSD